jgi:hypothetical protein
MKTVAPKHMNSVDLHNQLFWRRFQEAIDREEEWARGEDRKIVDRILRKRLERP